MDVSRSRLYAYRARAKRVNVERRASRSRAHDLFIEGRSSAGNRIRQRMSRRGDCWVNSPMERLFRSLKTDDL